MQLHTAVLPDACVKHARLPRSLVMDTIRRLKESHRISRGFRNAPPLTAKDIARIVLGLSALSPTAAVAHEREIGALALAEGNTTLLTAEEALVALVESCAGHRSQFCDLAVGNVVVGTLRPSFELHSRRPDRAPLSLLYGTVNNDGAQAYFTIPIPTVRAIVRNIIE